MIEQDVEVEGRPAFGPPEPGDVPGPGLVGPRGHELGLGVAGMAELISPLSDRLVRSQDPVHRALGAQIPAFIEQRRDDLGRRPVDEARAGEHVEDVRAFGRAQGPGGRRTGLLMPGSGPPATVEGSPWRPQRSARRRHADLRCERLGSHQQSFPCSRLNPSSPATFLRNSTFDRHLLENEPPSTSHVGAGWQRHVGDTVPHST